MHEKLILNNLVLKYPLTPSNLPKCSTYAKFECFNSIKNQIINNLTIKTPVSTPDLPKCSTILCHRPHCNYKVCNYMLHIFCYFL